MALRADENPRDIANTIPEVIHDLLKDVHTAIQGTIVTYDPATRRARVRPSLRRRDESGAVVDRPEIDQVPVSWPGGDGTTAHATLQEGDQVYLIYSMRGYRAWLEKHEPAVQDLEGFLSGAHPVAVPWFGTSDPLTAPRGGFARGLTLQTDDGVLAARLDKDAGTVELLNGDQVRTRLFADRTVHEVGSDSVVTQTASSITHRIGSNTTITQTAGAITFVVGGVTVATFTAGGSAFTGPAHTHRGTNVGDTHKHPYTAPLHSAGAADTGNPK